MATDYFLGISEKAFFGTGRGFVVPLTLFLTSAGKDERMKPVQRPIGLACFWCISSVAI